MNIKQHSVKMSGYRCYRCYSRMEQARLCDGVCVYVFCDKRSISSFVLLHDTSIQLHTHAASHGIFEKSIMLFEFSDTGSKRFQKEVGHVARQTGQRSPGVPVPPSAPTRQRRHHLWSSAQSHHLEAVTYVTCTSTVTSTVTSLRLCCEALTFKTFEVRTERVRFGTW